MPHEIEEVVFAEMSDQDLQPVLDVINRLNREVKARSADLTLPELRVYYNSPGSIRRHFVVRHEDRRVAGIADARYFSDDSNPDLMSCQIKVLPEFRRRGIGSSLLGHVAGIADELARRRLLSWHFDTVPAGGEFARAIGARSHLQHHENLLLLENLDADLMRRWMEEGPRRAPGHSVQVVAGELGEELFDDMAHLYHVLERDMPMMDGFQPREWTAEMVREMQEHYLDSMDVLTAIAFRDQSGVAVGMSQLTRRHSDPTTWVVTTTMVDPDHRGKSIGKWVKGAVNLAALQRWSDGVYQETGNAFVNEAMLAINHAMGFRHELTVTEVEIGVTDALAYVASRG